MTAVTIKYMWIHWNLEGFDYNKWIVPINLPTIPKIVASAGSRELLTLTNSVL